MATLADTHVADVAAARAAAAPLDRSGRDRMAWNIMASWGGHAVFVVAGFLMPRLIDEHLGQSSLGIWDFSWSIVSYFVLAQVGVGSSVNRYISKFRTAGDVDGLRAGPAAVPVVVVAARRGGPIRNSCSRTNGICSPFGR